jgi:hypothetical protein
MKIYLAAWPVKKDPGGWRSLSSSNQASILISFYWLMQEQMGVEIDKNIFCRNIKRT